MGKPEQDDNRKFEDGIFSGAGSSPQYRYNYNGQQQQSSIYYNVNAGKNTDLRGYGPRPPYYYNGCSHGCFGCAGCPKNKKTDNTSVIIAAIVSVVVLFLAFMVTVCCLLCVFFMKESKAAEERKGKAVFDFNEESIPYQEAAPEIEEAPSQTVPFDEWPSGKPPKTENGNSGEYYGEIKDSIRTDLEYTVEWENYEYAGNTDKVMIAVDYPVLKGDIPNLNIINDIIDNETVYFEEYYDEYSKYMLPGEVFGVYSEGFVTYMDEEVMSVVFCEKIYTDYWVDCGLYCVNIDIENGVVLDNSSILDVTDEFAVDFRTRSEKQNGDIGALDYMTDQEVAYYLSTAGTAILFYTPMGMEVGLNYGEDYVTVTYGDYKKYLQKF